MPETQIMFGVGEDFHRLRRSSRQLEKSRNFQQLNNLIEPGGDDSVGGRSLALCKPDYADSSSNYALDTFAGLQTPARGARCCSHGLGLHFGPGR